MIHVTENYTLSGDEVCVSVHRKRISKDKKKIDYPTEAYFPNFELALKAVIQKEISSELNGHVSELSVIVEKINGLDKKIETTIDRIVEKYGIQKLQATESTRKKTLSAEKRKMQTQKQPDIKSPRKAKKQKKSKEKKTTIATWKGNSTNKNNQKKRGEKMK